MYCHHFIDQVTVSNTLLPILAIVVSIISLGFSLLSHRHNKKTVEPLLTHLYTSDITATVKPHPNQSLSIKNCGFGPAIIKSMIFTIKNKRYKNLLTMFNENIKNSEYEGQSYFRILEDYVIASNDEVPVFEISFQVYLSSDAFLQLRELLCSTTIDIEYRTIYGKRIYYSKPVILNLNTKSLET